MTEKQFDRLCKRIKTIVGSGAQRDWDVGTAMNKIHASGLWKKRKRPDGDYYTHFSHFCGREFGMSQSTFMRCRRIAKTFKRDELGGVSADDANVVANVRSSSERKRLLKMPSTEIRVLVRRKPQSELYYKVSKDKGPIIPRQMTLSDLTNFMVMNPRATFHVASTQNGGVYVRMTMGSVTYAASKPSASLAFREVIASLENARYRRRERRKAA